MITISIRKDAKGKITDFCSSGHAGYGAYGQDIICSAVSALVINAINSVETLTSDHLNVQMNDSGFLEFHIVSEPSKETMLLLDSMLLGLVGIQKDYGSKYITIKNLES